MFITISFIAIYRIFFDLFNAIIFFSMFTFYDLNQSMCWLKRKPFSWSNITRFRHEHNLIVTRVFVVNNIIGSILLLFFLGNYPTNAYFLVLIIIKNRIPLRIKFFIVFYMLHQFAFIIATHLLAASYR